MNADNLCTLYIVRHGESRANVTGMWGANEPLTDKGKAQAKALYEKMKGVHFDAVYSSDLIRAQQTVELIALEKKLQIKTTEALRERYYGTFEGKNDDEVLAELQGNLAELEHYYQKESWHEYLNDKAESNHEALTRFITHLREIAIAHPNQTVLVGSHGNLMRILLIHLGCGDFETLIPGAIQNTDCITLKSDGVDFFIEEVPEILRPFIK